MEYLGIKLQSSDYKFTRLTRLHGVIGYVEASRINLEISDRDLEYHITVLNDHKGVLYIQWKEFNTRLALVFEEAWDTIGCESVDSVTHLIPSEEMPSVPGSWEDEAGNRLD